MKKPGVGTIAWIDLTVRNAEEIRSFYQRVTGWKTTELDMGGYSDFCMTASSNQKTVAGICHARGHNADLPAQWLVYITVRNLDESISLCMELGGKVVAGPKELGSGGRFCVIQDPAGAVAALFEP